VTFQSFPQSQPVFIAGDFNARLHARLPDENGILGPHVFGRGLAYIQQMSDPTAENRRFFTEFCIEHDLLVSNTFFQKPAQQQITFREAGADHAPPWSPDKFAQLDFFLAPQRWRNCVQDVASQSHCFIDSDHYLIVARVQIKLKKPQPKAVQRYKFRVPDVGQINSYNQYISHCLSQKPDNTMSDFLNAMKDASNTKFDPIPLTQRRSYISQHTWDLIQQRQAAHAAHDNTTTKELTAKIKREAKKDRKQFLLDSLQESADPRAQWVALKKLTKKSTPNFTKLQDKNGNRVGPSRRAEAIAEYLQDVQWKEAQLPQQIWRRPIVQDSLPFHIGPIELQELDYAIKKARANKAPGPDAITAELFKFLDRENRLSLLKLLNQWWSCESIPDEHLLAQVVSIFKKGNTDQISNYRPISLLNIIYKLFAAILQKRLADQIDPFVSESQFGFRKQRDTTQALYIARRLQDIAEQSGENVILTALDWEKAFDRISHDRMLQALARLGIPDKLRKVIGCIYSRPTFCVKHDHHLSDVKTQNAGIRQGCPLSPYLFILVMSVMFHDIHADIDREICNSRLDRIRFTEILYADDTLLVTKNTAGTNALLNKIERESAYYGLKLNQNKCCVLSMNGRNRIRFLDGTAVPHAEEITYLGGSLTSNISTANEVSNRISAAMATWKKLDVFWKQAQCSTGNKIGIFDAVVKSRLLYGLETLEIPKSQMSRLEAFHLKGLRKILEWKRPSSIELTLTRKFFGERICQWAQEIIPTKLWIEFLKF